MIGSVAIVGAGLAGATAARDLLAAGVTGPITVIGAEPHHPYDRPPLSKEALHRAISVDDHALLSSEEVAGLRWRTDTRAIGITAVEAAYRIDLDDGAPVSANSVVVATGARARGLIGDHLAGVYTLRTLQDASELRASLVTSRRVVVIGAGFIGAEVGATAAALGASVTIVEASQAPGASALGPDVAQWTLDVHRAHGITVLTGTAVSTLNPDGEGRVRSVTLADGTVLAADTVVIGIGARPETEWAASSGLAIDDGFVTDENCATSMPRVYAVGDCARVFDPLTGWHHRHEHWSAAVEHGRRAAAAILGSTPPRRRAVYFWSDQHGHRIQVCGSVPAGQAPTVVTGALHTPLDTGSEYLAVYGDPDDPVAAIGVDAARGFTRIRKRMDARLATSALAV
ncbi:NAD(P)/FAD-dependent oxidoreductase [Williamsia sterculiae]|uniref:NADPH-dependent 2,4-dienoyl-CoA reductase, sulfur reductase n=1 Tax=Williamsia sterculiae TaxID=1344003 RepID=A0A1N7ECU0_9NOCA|nr:FAD-dependent oxidoreductase [Williamsia sterculiae]SIR85897.1 NADPH-dependent 2,4-dienoyl-CoA reductase, sulfur reductase [Williamsia sterculiae]